MPGSPPPDRRDPTALARSSGAAPSSSDPHSTAQLPGASTMVVEPGEPAPGSGELLPGEATAADDAADDVQTAATRRLGLSERPPARDTDRSPALVASTPASPGAASSPGTSASTGSRAAVASSTGAAGASAPGTAGGSSLLTDESRFASPLDALQQDEIRRSRLLARFGLLLGAVVAVTILFLPGNPTMTAVIYAAVAVASIGNAWLHVLSGRPDAYRSRGLAVIWVMNAIAVSVGVVYFGVFSAGAIVIMLGIYFMALGQSFALALSVYLTCAGIRGAVAIGVGFGLMRDPGLIHAGYLPREVLLLIEGLLQLVFLAAFVMARASRRATLSAVTDYERVVRALAQREVLLHEARQDLERALQLGGVGRFTGQTIGSFRLGSILGRGSMGEVYDATRVTTGEPAAVKLLQPASMGNPSYLMRFLREVEVAAALDVPNVVRVLEVGNASAPVPYLAMERLQGIDLAQLLRERRRLDTDQVLELCAQAGRGIDAAGRAGVVHRDLKPQNLFLADQPAGRPIWKVLDFGVSKLLAERGTLTQGQVVGTPVYMAPEQAQGLDVDPRADQYALAAIAYRCLTGHLPYRARDVPTIMYQVVYRMPIRPGALIDLHEDVDAALLVAMAKEPASRFASADQLAGALEDAARGRLSDEVRARARELGRVHPWRPGP